MSVKNYFRDSSDDDPLFFDEGPKVYVQVIAGINTGSIDISSVNPYRQGVSITNQQHHDAGIVKITSGEPGHRLLSNRYGMGKNVRSDLFFRELDYFDPEAFIRAQSDLNYLALDDITFPIIVGDNDQNENFNLNGVIEPLPIREVASFTSIEAPFQSRGVKSAMMCGNIDQDGGCDAIKTVDVFFEKQDKTAFLDLIDMFGSYSTIGFFESGFNPIEPFIDSRRATSVPISSYQSDDIKNALSLMTGSTENYVNPEQKSASSGWDYENNNFPGADSIAFGGMTH